MDFIQLVKKARSRRRFFQEKSVDKTVLRSLVEMARYTPSARNLQPLKYKIVNEPALCDKVFHTLSWAGYIKDGAPVEGERPAAYIVVCNDNDISDSASLWDQGVVAQTILLGAADKALGGCIIASIKKDELIKALSLEARFDPVLVLALGYSKETVVITDVKEDGGIRYYRDQDGVHYVPKRVDLEIL